MPFANFKSDAGSVVLEFIGFGVLVQVPLLLASIALTGLQRDQLAADAINRDALRSFTLQGQAPEVTAAEIAADFNVEQARVNIQMDCADGDCNSPGVLVRLTTTIGSAIATGFAYK